VEEYKSGAGCALLLPVRLGPPLPAAHFERNDITIICETVHKTTPPSATPMPACNGYLGTKKALTISISDK